MKLRGRIRSATPRILEALALVAMALRAPTAPPGTHGELRAHDEDAAPGRGRANDHPLNLDTSVHP